MAEMSIYNSDGFDTLFEFDFGGYASDALDEASKVVEAKMKANAKRTVLHEGESEMVNSIKASKAKRSKNGAWIINVGPRGYSKTKVYRAKDGKGIKTSRTYAVSNALKAIWKEYGIPSRDNFHAQPFISPTVSQTKEQVYSLLQKKFEEKMK